MLFVACWETLLLSVMLVSSLTWREWNFDELLNAFLCFSLLACISCFLLYFRYGLTKKNHNVQRVRTMPNRAQKIRTSTGGSFITKGRSNFRTMSTSVTTIAMAIQACCPSLSQFLCKTGNWKSSSQQQWPEYQLFIGPVSQKLCKCYGSSCNIVSIHHNRYLHKGFFWVLGTLIPPPWGMGLRGVII